MTIDWLYVCSTGAFAGLLGQGARVVVGLKKTNDAASASALSIADLISPSRLVVSLLIGAIAGSLCAVGMSQNSFSQRDILTIAAAGYAGADFIEGFMQRGGAPISAGDPAAASAADPATAAANQDGAVG